MAIQKNGPHGKVSGKLGKLVFYDLNGVNVARVNGVNKAPASINQLVVRQRMEVISLLLSLSNAFIKVGFLSSIKGTNRNQHNEATSYNLKNALKGTYPNIEIDYPKVLLSDGPLDAPINVRLQKSTNAIELTWDMDPAGDGHAGENRSMVHVVFPVLNKSFTFFNEAKRSDGKFTQELPSEMLTSQVEVYLAFSDLSTNSTSPSVWALPIS
jgi:hypothetical protein